MLSSLLFTQPQNPSRKEKLEEGKERIGCFDISFAGTGRHSMTAGTVMVGQCWPETRLT